MKIIINAVEAFINSIKVDLEIRRLAKELERKGHYLTDPQRIQFKAELDSIECYAITKNGIRRIRSFGYNPKLTDGKQNITYIKNILTRHGYTIEKIYVTPVNPTVGKLIKMYTVTPRTMGE